MSTGGAAAAIVAVGVTCFTGLRGGAAVRTWITTLQELHVVWTLLVCEVKTALLPVCNSKVQQLHMFCHLYMFALLQQKVLFLHCWGLPPAWTHSLENSEMVLQTTVWLLFPALHISAIQALVKDSTSRRFWQLLNGALEKIWSQNFYRKQEQQQDHNICTSVTLMLETQELNTWWLIERAG